MELEDASDASTSRTTLEVMSSQGRVDGARQGREMSSETMSNANQGESFCARQTSVMKSYMALPDMEDIKFSIDRWLAHQLVETRSYITAEELYDLWNRVYEVQASTAELAFLFSFLVASGAASLTHTAGLDAKTIYSLYSIDAAKKFVTEALVLLSMGTVGRSAQAKASGSHIEGQSEAYDWCSISRCPPLLLASRTHSILCIFFHQARDARRSMQHGNLAIQTARQYGLFEELCNGNGQAPSPLSRAWHIYGLRRLHFDLSVYPRLAMSLHITEQCILQPEEVCDDPGRCAAGPNGKRLLDPLALDYQCVKLVLSEMRATTYYQSQSISAMSTEMDEYGDGAKRRGPTASERLHNPSRKQTSDCIIENDDAVLAIIAKLPSWTQLDARSNWTLSPVLSVHSGTSAINILWARYSCNRIRTENLLQVENPLELTPEIQARALGAAQDTLFLLAQVLNLLRTPFSFASSRDWLYSEADWAVSVFNKVMMAEIAQEMAARKDSTTSSSKSDASEGEGTSPPSNTSLSLSTSKTTSVVSSTATSVVDSPSAHPHPQKQKQKQYQQGGSLFDSSGAKHRSYDFFAWFIFGFKGIYTVLQDLHCFSPALFESSKMLMRLQVPRPLPAGEEVSGRASTSQHDPEAMPP